MIMGVYLLAVYGLAVYGVRDEAARSRSDYRDERGSGTSEDVSAASSVTELGERERRAA